MENGQIVVFREVVGGKGLLPLVAIGRTCTRRKPTVIQETRWDIPREPWWGSCVEDDAGFRYSVDGVGQHSMRGD